MKECMQEIKTLEEFENCKTAGWNQCIYIFGKLVSGLCVY